MSQKKIIIIGQPRHGKTELGGITARILNASFGNTSDTIYESLAAKGETTVEALRKIPKEDIRERLINEGDRLCLDNPAFLSLKQLETHRIVCGVRKPPELYGIKQVYPDAVVVWVERPAAQWFPDNTSLTREAADYVVVNDGSLEDLEVKMRGVLVLMDLKLHHPGHHLWGLLHTWSFQGEWDEHQRRNFFTAFGTMMQLCFGDGCPCLFDFEKIKMVVPPPADRGGLLTWGFVVHDFVNFRRGLTLHFDWTRQNPMFQKLLEAFADGAPPGVLSASSFNDVRPEALHGGPGPKTVCCNG